MPAEAMPTSKPAINSRSSKGAKPAPPPQAVGQGLKIDASCNFVFMGHPQRVDVFQTDKGPEVLHLLNKFEFQPGINGVVPVKNRQDGDPSYALAAKAQTGWLQIPTNVPVVAFGESDTGYVQRFENIHGYDVHLEAWVRPYVVGGSVEFERDGEGYIEFLRYIRDNIMPPIDENVKKGLKSKLTLMHRTAKSSKSAMSDDIVESMAGKLVAFDAPKGKK